MHTRLLTFSAATDIDGGVTYIREDVLPILTAQQGFRAVTVSANRAANVLGILSVWEGANEREASDSALGKARDEALAIVGGELTIENLEVVAAALVKPVTLESSLLVTRVSMDPAEVDDIIDFFKTDVLPVFTSQQGFCGVHNMVDRSTGKAVVGSAWENHEALDAYLSIQPERRTIAESHGVHFDGQETRQVLLSHSK